MATKIKWKRISDTVHSMLSSAAHIFFLKETRQQQRNQRMIFLKKYGYLEWSSSLRARQCAEETE